MERTPTNREIIADRLHGLVNPQYERDAAELVTGRRKWRQYSNILDASSKILSGISTILAFTASAIPGNISTDWTAFSAGCFGTVSLVLAGFSVFSSKASSERTRELNVILGMMGVTPVPDLETQATSDVPAAALSTSESLRRASPMPA